MPETIDFTKMNEIIATEESRPTPICIEEAVALIKKSVDITRLIESSGKLAIKTLEDARVAVEMANQSRKIINRLQDTKDQILRPHIDFQRAINKLVKESTDVLEKLRENAEKKLSDYLNSPDCFVGDMLHSIDTDEGSMTRTKKWVYEIVDEKKIPCPLMSADDKKIKAAIKAGIREIEGIKIYEIEEISFRVKN